MTSHITYFLSERSRGVVTVRVKSLARSVAVLSAQVIGNVHHIRPVLMLAWWRQATCRDVSRLTRDTSAGLNPVKPAIGHGRRLAPVLTVALAWPLIQPLPQFSRRPAPAWGRR